MKNRFTLLNLLLLFAFTATAQDVTGIWKGYFVQNTFGLYEDRYKFEVQIEQIKNGAINGVTYSYKTTVFYGKAELKGIYTSKTKNLLLNEIKLLDVKIDGQSEACLMTCYLDYDKLGSLETLTGTYNSRNLKDKGDCGSGKVYLEKSATSDFYKEDFLVKRENEAKKKQPLAKKQTPPNSQAIVKAKPVSPKIATTPPRIKPGAEDAIVNNKPDKPAISVKPEVPKTVKPEEQIVKTPKIIEKPLPKPDVIKNRGNELVKTYYTSAKEIKIELYDNGEIDGDTISVYHNNKLIVSRKGLTYKPITFTIHADEDEPEHEFVMVAENEGTIPPNTALMVITAGTQRYELFVTSNEKKNAVVMIKFKPDSK